MINFVNIDRRSRKLIKTVYKATLKYFNQADIFCVEISNVAAEEIKELNKEARGVDAVTDVLSFPTLNIKSLPVTKTEFPFDIDYDINKLILGEIVLCQDKIEEQAKEFGHSEERESAYLALHGILHLLGFDHIDETDKKIMRAHEETILEKLKITRE